MISHPALFKAAYGQYAIGAFSVNGIEQILGVLAGARAAQTPVILQVSSKAREYAGAGVLEAAIHAAAQNYADVLYGVHLDHGSEAGAHACIDSGAYSSVMVDTSMLEFAENVAAARRVVEHAHARGVAVEAELGRLGGKEDDVDVGDGDAYLTDPQGAAEFVRQSGVDALAVAVGTRHGVAKFRGAGTLNLERLARIKDALPGVPLVLHGASTVPPTEIARINAAGGRVDATARGVSDDLYRAAIARGVAKINVDTDSRLIWTRVLREHLLAHPENIDFRAPGQVFITAFAELVAHHCAVFGSAGQAPALRATLAFK